MKTEEWSRLAAEFDRLCDLPAALRDEPLAALTREDPELAARLRAMLAADDTAGGVLAGGPEAFDSAARPDQFDDLAAVLTLEIDDASLARSLAPGDRLGPWRLVSRLGAGGMGEVWTADRADGAFEQRVAIKLLRRGFETRTLLWRFLLERRILARLIHPCIARLLDAGSTADGRPYFVMELVTGRPITAWACEERMGVEGRVELLLEVCDAVDFAHRNLVVHRDLKPSNVLVSDGGKVKLLDFGIAKLLDRSDGPQTTSFGDQALTPAYAAPEQIRGEPVTTATDVYSLGILLYELLTGRLPHDRVTKSLPQLVAGIERETVERPSSAVRAMAANTAKAEAAAGSAIDAVAAVGGLNPARLARRLAGDLDTIVLKALAREPERRYPGAAALAEDLRRHLAGRPVAARPDSLAYRARKFVGRHLGSVAAASAALALGVLLATYYTVRITQERDRARLERAKAEQIAGFLTNLFKLTDLDQTKGVKLSVRELVDRGASTLERGLEGEPEVAATLSGLIGNLYAQLDLKEQARPLLELALETRRRTSGSESAEVAASERDLGAVLWEVGEAEAAQGLVRHALAIEERIHGAESVAVARTRTLLSGLLKSAGDWAAASAELEQARAILERAGPPAAAELAQALTQQGQMFLSVGEPERALAPFERAREIRERLLGPDSPSTAASLLNLAAALRETGDVDAAIVLDDRVAALAERSFGSEHSLYAYAAGELAMAWRSKGEAERSREYYEQAVRVFARSYGSEDSSTLLYRRGLATLLAEMGDARGALGHFTAILEIRSRLLAADHPRLAESLMDVARAELALGDGRGVETNLRRAVSIYRAKLAPDSVDLALGAAALGEYLCAHGEPLEGGQLLDEALRIWTRNPSPEAPDLSALAVKTRQCESIAARAAGRR